MKKYLAFLIFAGLSSCIDAQTVKETVRGKYGENLGTAETTVRGGKRVTVYKDKYGQITGTSESKTHSFGKTTTVYKDKYGQVTRKGKVKGRLPNKSSNYYYGWSSSKSKGK